MEKVQRTFLAKSRENDESGIGFGDTEERNDNDNGLFIKFGFMLVPFDSLPDTARIWIYQGDRPFDSAQRDSIVSLTTQFLENWEAHGAPLTASFRIRHDRFLIIGVDEQSNPVTGCSTDAQVRFVQALQSHTGINFFDRTQIALMRDDVVESYPLNEVREKKVELGQDTLTFNNLVNTKGQLSTEWVQPAGQSWLARYI